MTNSSTSQWILLLSLTALLLSLAVLSQIASRYATAYLAAPREISSFIDAVDSSVAENESYDRDVAKVPRLEDKLRLGRLLREIQKGGDDLREGLNDLLVGGGDGGDGDDGSSDEGGRLRTGARILWAGKRVELEERLRRLDLLRMRFLVIYMGIVAGTATEAAAKQQQQITPKDPEKAAAARREPGHLSRSLTDGIIRDKPPLRRLTTLAIGHGDSVETPHRVGWAGVVKELQRSPLLHKRHASIETAMSRTP